jgi:methylmalonyl-CoA/ethylmalonyl-CoA epimerase
MTSPTTTLVRGLSQVAFVVDDLPAAIRFWRDVLGLRLLFEAPPGLAFFDLGGVRLMLSRPEPGGSGGANSILYLRVDDIRAAHAALVERGLRFETAPHCIAKLTDAEVWLADFRDPERNVLCLMSEVPTAA